MVQEKEIFYIKVNVFDKGNRVTISIKDTEIGVKKDMLDKNFDRFKQASPLFTRSHEGSGIGLSLVKSLVESHNGKIDIESTHGIRSEFIIELPVKIVKEKMLSNQSMRMNLISMKR